MQGLLQEDRAKQADLHVRGGGWLRDQQGPEEQVSVLQIQKVYRTGYGASGRAGGSNAWRQKLRCGIQPL